MFFEALSNDIRHAIKCIDENIHLNIHLNSQQVYGQHCTVWHLHMTALRPHLLLTPLRVNS